MKRNVLKSAAAAVALLLAGSPSLEAQQNFVFNTGSPIVNSAAFGGQIGHQQAGAFGSFGAGDRWIGIGNPTFMGGPLPVYGMRIQDAGEIGTLSLNQVSGAKDLDLQWGPNESARFNLNFIQDPNNPSAVTNVITALSSGRVSMGTAPKSATLTLDAKNNTYALDARTFAGIGRAAYFQGQYLAINAEVKGITNSIITSRYSVYTNTSTTSGSTNYGVYGQGRDASFANYGVRGFASNSIFGGPSITGTAYGVYGSVSGGGTKFAGYFAGNVTVTGTFNNSSDRRLKDNIANEENAIDRIMQLRPTTYEYKKDEKYREMYLAEGLQHGFIAQEVEEVFPEMVGLGVQILGEEQYSDPDAVVENGEKPVEKFEYKTVNYMAMIPVLTKGMQEQQNEIELQAGQLAEKDAEIAELRAENTALNDRLIALEDRFASLEGRTTSKADAPTALDAANVLYQNTPNPFSSQTIIRYELTEGTRNAEILVFDMNGRQLRSFNNLKAGDNSLTIEGSELEAGMYFYSLIVNGAEVATKRMILTK